MTRFFINPNIESQERFDLSKFMAFTDNYDPLTSAFLEDILKLPESSKYEVLSEEERPDLVSYRVYGDVQFWWIIMLYNGLEDFRDITTGLVLNIPSLDDIEDVFFKLKSQETSQ